MIPYARQSVVPEDIEAVVQVLKSDFLTQGPAVVYFEEQLAHVVSVEHCVMLSSGTAALHLACLCLGLKSGDWLWTVPNTFVASAVCGLYCGAYIDFVDIDPVTRNLDLNHLENKLKHASLQKRLPKVLVVVHFSGLPCEMESIKRVCDDYGVKIIEDACHALGAADQTKPVGSCQYSDITVFSFHPVKSIASGEGGALCTNDETYARQARRLRHHGISVESPLRTEKPYWYEQIELGFNYRMTDMQAALGASQLRRLDQFNQARLDKATVYQAALKEMPLLLPQIPSDKTSAWHLFVVELLDTIGMERDVLLSKLRQAGIGVHVHYIPVYWHPSFQALGFRRGLCPNAEIYYCRAMTLPLYPDMTTEQQTWIVSHLKKYLV